MEAVARRARVTRVTIYHQFESKAQLLEAVFDEFAASGGLASLPKIFGEREQGEKRKSQGCSRQIWYLANWVSQITLVEHSPIFVPRV